MGSEMGVPIKVFGTGMIRVSATSMVSLCFEIELEETWSWRRIRKDWMWILTRREVERVAMQIVQKYRPKTRPLCAWPALRPPRHGVLVLSRLCEATPETLNVTQVGLAAWNGYTNCWWVIHTHPVHSYLASNHDSCTMYVPYHRPCLFAHPATSVATVTQGCCRICCCD